MTDPAAAAAPVGRRERIVVLDVLRGFALLGMILVHFHSYANTFHDLPGHDRTTAESAIGWGVWLLAETKSYATFAFLFGVGFAVQLRRRAERGAPFVGFYLRRLMALGLIGLAERAQLRGGRLEGRREGQQFVLRGWIPWAAVPPDQSDRLAPSPATTPAHEDAPA